MTAAPVTGRTLCNGIRGQSDFASHTITLSPGQCVVYIGSLFVSQATPSITQTGGTTLTRSTLLASNPAGSTPSVHIFFWPYPTGSTGDITATFQVQDTATNINQGTAYAFVVCSGVDLTTPMDSGDAAAVRFASGTTHTFPSTITPTAGHDHLVIAWDATSFGNLTPQITTELNGTSWVGLTQAQGDFALASANDNAISTATINVAAGGTAAAPSCGLASTGGAGGGGWVALRAAPTTTFDEHMLAAGEASTSATPSVTYGGRARANGEATAAAKPTMLYTGHVEADGQGGAAASPLVERRAGVEADGVGEAAVRPSLLAGGRVRTDGQADVRVVPAAVRGAHVQADGQGAAYAVPRVLGSFNLNANGQATVTLVPAVVKAGRAQADGEATARCVPVVVRYAGARADGEGEAQVVPLVKVPALVERRVTFVGCRDDTVFVGRRP